MKKTNWMHWLAVMILTLTCSVDLWAQQTITFMLTNNELIMKGETPTLKQGETLVVEIANVTTAQTTWSFTFGGLSLSANMPTAEIPLRFESNIIPTTISGPIELEFQDTSGTVNYGSENPSILIPFDIVEGMNAVTSMSARLRKMYDRTRNEINLYFDENGFLYQGINIRHTQNLPSDVDDNDVINIFLIGKGSDIKDLMINVTGTFTSEDINILGSTALADLSKNLGSLQGTGEDDPHQIFTMGSYGPYSPPSVSIEIKKRSDNSVLRSHTFRIVRNYIASFRFGVGSSNIRFNNYDIKTIKDVEGKCIKNIADEDGEPRYFLNVIFYSWQFWNDRFWKGRDITETPRFIDRINPYVGVGLKDIGEEFLFGFSFEIARGLDLTWGVHVAKTQVLNGGFSLGDSFEGQKTDIPTEYNWIAEPNLFGFSVDLRVATQILGSLFSGGE